MKVTASVYKNWTIIHIDGNFKVSELVDARPIMEKCEKQAMPLVAIDFSKVEYIDSSAVGLMTNFAKRVLPKNGKIAVFAPSDEIYDLFDTINFGEAVPVYRTREEFEQNA